MQVARTNPRALNPRALASHSVNLSHAFAFGLLTSTPFVLALALFLATRRALGAMTAALDPLPLVAIALVMLAWVWLMRAVWRGPTSRPANAKINVDLWGVGAAWASLLMVAFACSFPGDRFLDWLIWLPTIAAAWFGPHAVASLRRKFARPSLSTRIQPHAGVETADRVVQQLTRYRSADGRDAMHGELNAEFAPGERNATLYVAFCPPFECLPHVEAHIADDFVAEAKLTQVLHNGAQIDVRLPRPPIGQTSVAVELNALEPERS